AIIAGDRNTGSDAQQNINSIWSNQPGQWEGGVVYNDNHANHVETALLATHYTSGPWHGKVTWRNRNPWQQTAPPGVKTLPPDNLFEATGLDDAMLIHSGN
ncbi:MAG: hypothetical protein MI741_17885, partial [Rhodospirillales bacterium]|nr:hypothetical protein [Rhodospirillales bacterium]